MIRHCNIFASISFLITVTPSVSTMIGSRDGSGNLSEDSISISLSCNHGRSLGIDDSVVVNVFRLVPLPVPANFSQHTRPHVPQLARNYRLLKICSITTAITMAVFAFATRKAVPVQRTVRTLHQPLGVLDKFKRRGKTWDVRRACSSSSSSQIQT
jgi:hypothetical protein